MRSGRSRSKTFATDRRGRASTRPDGVIELFFYSSSKAEIELVECHLHLVLDGIKDVSPFLSPYAAVFPGILSYYDYP